jgi:hypothetical protein
MPISGMKQGSGKSRFAGRVFACAVSAVAVMALAAPTALAQSDAVDEYTLTLPQAGEDQQVPPGSTPPGTGGGVPQVTAPPPGEGGTGSTEAKGSLVKDLKGIAKKPELGAPQPSNFIPGGPNSLGPGGRGVPEIVADTVDESEGGAPALLAALGAIAAAGVWVGLRRRRSKLRITG